MPKDPKEVMDQIKAILEESQLAGYLVLVAPDKMEYSLHLAVDWGCLSYDPETGEIRINSTQLDSDQKREKVVNSVSIIMGIMNMAATHSEALAGLSRRLGKRFNITHILKDIE